METMSISGLIALGVCFLCVLAKMFFTFRIRANERNRQQEHEIFQNTRNDLHRAKQKNVRLEAEQKLLDSRRSTVQRNIHNAEKKLKELQLRKREDDAVRAAQAEIIKGTKKSK